MDFGDAVMTGFRKYATFEGRARRSEFWWWTLFQLLVSMGAAALDATTGTWPMMRALIGLALLLPSLAVGVRRLHDTDRSGWWWLIVLVPIVGIILLIVWWCTDGMRGPNRYGPDPKTTSLDPFAPAVAPRMVADLPPAAPAASPAPAPPASGPAPTSDKLARLEQLGRLRDQGVLTEAEFEAEKAKILAEGV